MVITGETSRRKILVIAAVLVAVALVAWVEAAHYYRFRHLVGYGIHMDVVLGNSEIGTRDMFYARVWNLSLHTLVVEGCRLPGGYVGEGILYRWDVQRWDQNTRQWNSLQGADHWVPEPFGGSSQDSLAGCKGELTKIAPLQVRVLGWVYKDWVTSNEPVRIAVHTSVSRPPEQQAILYTNLFVVRHFAQ